MPPSPDDARHSWVRGVQPPAGTPVSARDPRLHRPHAGGHEPPAAATPPPAKRRATRWDQPTHPNQKRAATSEKPADVIVGVVNYCNQICGAYADLPVGQTGNFINYNPSTSNGATNVTAGNPSEPLNLRSLLAATQTAPTFVPPPPIDCLELSDIDLRELMTIPPPPLSFPRAVPPPSPPVVRPAAPSPPSTIPTAAPPTISATTPPIVPQRSTSPLTNAPSIPKPKAKNPPVVSSTSATTPPLLPTMSAPPSAIPMPTISQSKATRAPNATATPQPNPPTPPVESSEQPSGAIGGISAGANGGRGQTAREVPAAAPVAVEAEVPLERTERPAAPDVPQDGGEEPMDIEENPPKEEPPLRIVEEQPPRPASRASDENIEWIVLPSDSSDASGEDSDDEVTILKVVPAPARRTRSTAASSAAPASTSAAPDSTTSTAPAASTSAAPAAPASTSTTIETPDSTTPRQQKEERMEASRSLTLDIAARRTCSTEAELPSIAQSPATEQPPASSSDQLRVPCTFCGRVFSSTADYWAHQAEHVPLEQRHQCDLCAFFATNSADLERHRQVHSPSLRCKEAACTYEAPNPEDLRKHHRRKHEEKRGYQCAKCDYQTIKKAELKEHKNTYGHRGHRRIPRSAVQKRKKRQTGAGAMAGAGAGAADGPADVFEFTETPAQAKRGSTPLDPRIPSPPRTGDPPAPMEEAPSSSGFAASNTSTNSSGFHSNPSSGINSNSNSGTISSDFNSNSNQIDANVDRSIDQSVGSSRNSNPTSNSCINAQVKHEQQLNALNNISRRFLPPVDSSAAPAASAPTPVPPVEAGETDGGELNWATVLMSPAAPAFLYFDYLMLNATVEKMPLGLWLENDSCRHLLLHVRGNEWSEQPPLGRCVFAGVMNRTEFAYDGRTNRSAHLLLFSKDPESQVIQRLVEELQSGPSFAELCDEILCGFQVPALILTTRKNRETCDAAKLAGTSVQLLALD